MAQVSVPGAAIALVSSGDAEFTCAGSPVSTIRWQ
jgi:hypothetical protein